MELIPERSKIKTLYGHFDNKQFEEYKVQLHRDLFWLLLYKDPKTKDNFQNVNYELYVYNLQKRLDGLNEILQYPTEIISIMSLVQAALIETRKECFNYQCYRKLVLDAHSLIDKINIDLGVDTNDNN